MFFFLSAANSFFFFLVGAQLPMVSRKGYRFITEGLSVVIAH